MSKKVFELTADFKIKDATEGEDFLIIEGYANAATKDRIGDVIVPEAWTKSGGLNNFLKNPILLAYHDHKNPIGSVIEHDVTKDGLKIVAKIFKESGNVFNLVKRGVLKAFSVGFMVKDADYNPKTEIFVIKDAELFEVSVVSVPMNADSLFSVRKSFDDNDEGFNRFKQEFGEVDDKNNLDNNSKELESKTKEYLDKIENSLSQKIEELLVKANSKEKTMAVEGGTPQVEQLIKDVEARLREEFEKKEGTLNNALEGLRNELSEKAEELTNLTKNKMQFTDKSLGSKVISAEVIDTAVMVAKLLGVPIVNTKYAGSIIEKAGPHLASMTQNWEQEFTTRVENDIRENLIVEPRFRVIPMNTPTLHIPINPEAGYGTWIASTYPPLGSVGDNTSTGGDTFGVDPEPQRHLLTDTTLTAYKLVAKEYIAYEEEEDSIIPIVPIIRDSIVRRMAKSADKALLRGQGSGATDPLTGICKYAADAGAETTISIGGAEKVTVDNLELVRRDMGIWGLNPRDVVYIVSHEGYFDLLEDPDFRTIDLVGTNATILRGQIGSCNGSPVVVSGEFEAKAAGKYTAVALNASNFIVGSLRGMMIERDKNVEDQRNIIVASRRWGFLQLIANKGVSVLTWAA